MIQIKSFIPPIGRIRERLTPRKWAVAALLMLAAFGGVSEAERPATYWVSPNGDFLDPANWSLGLPSTILDARIDNSGVALINTEAFQSIPYVYLGSEQNTSGTLEINTGGIANFTTMIVGALNATGTLNILGGGKLTSFGGPIGSDYLGVGVATVDGAGSNWTVTGSEMAVGGNGTGTVRLLNNGSLVVAGGNGKLRLANHPVSEGNLRIGNGGAAGTLSASEIFNGEGRATVIFNHTNPSLSFAPKFTGLKTVNGYLNIRHEGPGTTILTAPESNLAGTIAVTAGTLLVSGKIMGSFREVLVDEEIVVEKNIGETIVQGGGTLGGTGFIEGKTTIGGMLAPGMSVGVLKFGGDLLLESTGRLKIELGGSIRGTQFDAIDVAGALTLGGTLELVLVNGFLPQEGQTFDLFDGFASTIGAFSSITFSADGYAGTFDPVTGILVVVPEPSVFGLSAIAALGLGLRRRRKK